MNTFCKLKQMRKMCNVRYSTLSKYITRETSLSRSTLSHTMSPAAGALFVPFSVLPYHHEIKVKASHPCHFIMVYVAVKTELKVKIGMS